MAKNTSRSMNADLARGAVDGKVRFLRPDAVGGASEIHARTRAQALHHEHYGSMGVDTNSYVMDEHRPDATVRDLAYPRFTDEPDTPYPAPY